MSVFQWYHWQGDLHCDPSSAETVADAALDLVSIEDYGEGGVALGLEVFEPDPIGRRWIDGDELAQLLASARRVREAEEARRAEAGPVPFVIEIGYPPELAKAYAGQKWRWHSTGTDMEWTIAGARGLVNQLGPNRVRVTRAGRAVWRPPGARG